MNERQKRLKESIDNNMSPIVVDATFIHNINENDIPFHWGDIEAIGYGSTSRYYDPQYDEIEISRNYTGPHTIVLSPTNFMMKTGDKKTD